MDYRGNQVSFLHTIYLPHIKTKLYGLAIHGPVPKEFPRCKLDSPHWALSNLAMPTPGGTSYRDVRVYDIAFPSFTYVVKYLNYFRDANRFRLSNITWDGKTSEHLLRFTKPITRYRRAIEVTAQGGTNDLWLSLQVAMLYPDFPLRRLVPQDQYWVVSFMNLIREFYSKMPKAEFERDDISYSVHGRKSIRLCIQHFSGNQLLIN